ncbi:hypothetical protein BH10PAT3_BH10PAT3_3080 [soil metagenome]
MKIKIKPVNKKKSLSFNDVLDLRTLQKKNKSEINPLQAWLIVGFFSIIVLIIGLNSLNKDKNIDRSKQELINITSLVNKHMILPVSETPTLATITDREKLEKNSFLYQKGKDGDKVLIYVKASRVIIYRPSIDRVVDVGPVTVDESIPEAKDATVIIQDSTDRPILVEKIKNKVQSQYSKAKVTVGESTVRKNYPNTIVIGMSDKKDHLVDSLASLIGAKRGILPLAELRPGSDLLIIIGQDSQSDQQ